MTSAIAAISLDLDDTLWPIKPVLQQAEKLILEWFQQHCPRVYQRYGKTGLHALRDQIARDHPHLSHDLGAQRRLCLRTALVSCGYRADLYEPVWDIYYRARMQVEPYIDVPVFFSKLTGHVEFAAVSNGNANLSMIGWDQRFSACIQAHEVGVRKPDPRIWQLLLDQLQHPAPAVLHIGDHPLEDVESARAAGLQAVWLSRNHQAWPLNTPPPTTIHRLDEIFTHPGLARIGNTTQTGLGES